MTIFEDSSEEVRKHYERNWGEGYNVYLFDKGPIEKLSPSFRVLEFKPNNERNMWTYATLSMSNYDHPYPIELHVLSSVQDAGLIELLAATVYYHQNTALLGLNHTVNFGQPWQDSSTCTHGFISLPYLDGPKLENLELDNKLVKFYWLIPVTEQEVEFKMQNGVEALENKFEESNFNYLAPDRSSVV